MSHNKVIPVNQLQKLSLDEITLKIEEEKEGLKEDYKELGEKKIN